MLNPQRSYEPDCGKYKYESVLDARKGILINWASDKDWTVHSFYPCSKCGGFHLTKQMPDGNGRTL